MPLRYLSYAPYAFTLVAQVVCAVHAIRKGNAGNWLFVILFLPLVGSILYFIVEMYLNASRRRST